jgi:excisionase family DNA binding protein
MLVIDDVLTAAEVAKLVKVSPSTVKRLANQGIIQGFKFGDQWRFKRQSIEEYVRKQEEQSRGQSQAE